MINELIQCDCTDYIRKLPSGYVDAIVADPPYLYLKKQKLDRVFDEALFFSECKRILKKDGMIILFGRGTSFYRWNTRLDNLGFKFKEEIIWDKCYTTSPCTPIGRVHETISIHGLGCSKIRKTKIPYLEQKQYDINKIAGDINRLMPILNNPHELQVVKDYLEKRKKYIDKKRIDGFTVSQQSGTDQVSRSVAVIDAIKNGMNEKDIINFDNISFSKGITRRDDLPSYNRSVAVLSAMDVGMKEKDIVLTDVFKETADHYGMIHPTQKPIRLFERLIKLVSDDGNIIFDPFAGSGNSRKAAYNIGRNYIGCEIDKEYYNLQQKSWEYFLSNYQLELIK